MRQIHLNNGTIKDFCDNCGKEIIPGQSQFTTTRAEQAGKIYCSYQCIDKDEAKECLGAPGEPKQKPSMNEELRALLQSVEQMQVSKEIYKHTVMKAAEIITDMEIENAKLKRQNRLYKEALIFYGVRA